MARVLKPYKCLSFLLLFACLRLISPGHSFNRVPIGPRVCHLYTRRAFNLTFDFALGAILLTTPRQSVFPLCSGIQARDLRRYFIPRP